MTNITRPWDTSDSRRDAERYHRLLLALTRATSEIRQMGEESQPSIDEVLSRLLPDLAVALNAQHAFAALLREDKDRAEPWLELTAVYPRQELGGHHLSWSKVFSKLIKLGKPAVIDPLGEPAPDFIAGLELFEATAAILARLQTLDQVYVVGVCNKARPDLGPFLAADGMALDNIVELLTIGAQMGERRRRELESIQRTSAAISAELDLQELLPLIARGAADVFGAPATSLRLWDENKENLVIRAKHGLSDAYAQQQRLPKEKIQAALEGNGEFQALLTSDLQSQPFGNIDLIKQERLRTVLSTPLRVRDELIGLLNIYGQGESRPSTSYEQGLAQIFANQAAIAVQNAELYTGAQSRARQLQDVLAAAQNITALRPIHEVLQAITNSLVDNFGYDAVTLFPYQAETKTFEPPVISGHLHFPDIVLGKATEDSLVKERLSGPVFYFTSASCSDPLLAGPFTHREAIQASGYVRLMVGGEIVGILFVNSRQPHLFNEAEQLAVRLFANQAAIAIHNTRQFEALQSRLGQLEMMLGASQGMITRKPLRERLQEILDHLVRIEGYDIATLYPYLPSLGTFDHPLSSGQLRNYTQVIGQFREGTVATRRLEQGPDEYFTSDAITDPLLAGPFVERERIKAAGSIRLRHGDRIVGLLFVNKRTSHDFTLREQETLRLYASQAAIALHEARVFRLGRERLAVLTRIGQEVGQSLRLETVLETLYTQLRTIFGADISPNVLLYDEIGQELHFLYPGQFGLVVDVPERQGQTRIKLGEGICGWVAAQKQALNVADVKINPHYVPMLQATQSELAVPILLGERLVGVLNVESSELGKFSADDQRLLEAVANQVAAAIRNAEQYERLERQQKQLLALHESAKAVTASLEQDQTLQAILAEAARLTGAHFATIQAKRESCLYFQAVYPSEGRLPLINKIGRGMSLTGPGITVQVANTGQPRLENDVLNVPEFVDGTNGLTRSELAVPLLEDGRIRGVLNVEHPEPNAFAAGDIDILTDLANLAVLALQNTDRYEQLIKNQQQLRALHEAGKMIVQAGLEMQAVLQAILDQAVTVTGAYSGILQLVKGDNLELVVAWPPDQLEQVRQTVGRLPINGPGITTRAVRQNDAQLVPDVTKDPDFVYVAGQTGSELAVVLRREGRPIGVLNVEHRQIGGLNEQDRNLLIALTNLAVVAIQNAERYQELQEVKDYGLANEAVAWLGLFGADWQHTINQKTFSISSYIEGLRRWLARREAPAEITGPVLEALDGIEKVTDNIRRVQFTGRVPSQTPDETNGETLIDQELQTMVTRWCHERQDIEQIFKLACPGLKVKIPPQWLRVAMEKLINNALKAMPQGGLLTVATEQVDDMVHVIIADTGHGIPDFARADFLKRTIGRPTNSQSLGTGKGALIARFIIRSYGGDLSLIYTRKGKGTKLLLTLPILK